MTEGPPTLLALGETMLRLGTKPGERLETADSLDVHVGGAESNVAVATQNLGIDATWCSKLPRSPLGRRVVRALRASNVSVAVEWEDKGRLGTYYIDPGGPPRGTSIVYDRADSAVTRMTPSDLPSKAIRESDAVFTSGITPALSETLLETTESLLESGTRAGTTTVFDVNYRSKLWDAREAKGVFRSLLPHVDVLVIADRDAETVLGRDSDPAAVASSLRDEYDCSIVVVTAGDAGAVAAHRDGIVEQPVVESDTLDPIGTGDAFVGGFLAWYLRGESIDRALRAAAATASLKRTIRGDMAIVTREDVIEAMDRRDRAIDR
ncbi:MAG: bifunctional 2-dehydro-3-deoxygluconokinase/2-dehydro-3-deoxygalactonokinase [Halodesulfurarchaeum sp.]